MKHQSKPTPPPPPPNKTTICGDIPPTQVTVTSTLHWVSGQAATEGWWEKNKEMKRGMACAIIVLESLAHRSSTRVSDLVAVQPKFCEGGVVPEGVEITQTNDRSRKSDAHSEKY